MFYSEFMLRHTYATQRAVSLAGRAVPERVGLGGLILGRFMCQRSAAAVAGHGRARRRVAEQPLVQRVGDDVGPTVIGTSASIQVAHVSAARQQASFVPLPLVCKLSSSKSLLCRTQEGID